MKAADLDRLAELHVSCLPDSIVSELGQGYTRAFYRYVERSPTEFLFVERGPDSAIIGACVVSTVPGSLNGRLLRRTSLLVHAFRHPARVATLGVRLILSAFRAAEGTHRENLPELILLFVSPAIRARGIGRGLVAQAEKRLSEMGVREYEVKTVADASNRALVFYDRMGFERKHVVSTLGNRFQVFTRTLRA